jgi:hypothetical protein
LVTHARTFSPSRRQQFTRTASRSPSSHDPLSASKRRSVLIRRKFATSVPFCVRRQLTSLATLPTTVTQVSFTVVLLLTSSPVERSEKTRCPQRLPKRESRRHPCGQPGGAVPVWTTEAADRSNSLRDRRQHKSPRDGGLEGSYIERCVGGGGWVFRRCPTLPRPGGRSTIGAGGLSFRVRDGSGRFPSAVATGTPNHPHHKQLWCGVGVQCVDASTLFA